MIAGIVLLCWGAAALFRAAADTANSSRHIISGSVISTVGGAMSAYITKTFLDVHRTSLLQLNHYFKQPVLNSHILSAQRLADRSGDNQAIGGNKVKEEMYKDLIKQVIALIAAEQAQSGDLNTRATPRVLENKKQRPGKGQVVQPQADADHDQHRAA